MLGMITGSYHLPDSRRPGARAQAMNSHQHQMKIKMMNMQLARHRNRFRTSPAPISPRRGFPTAEIARNNAALASKGLGPMPGFSHVPPAQAAQPLSTAPAAMPQQPNPMQALLDQYQQAHDTANQKNESRYQAIRGGQDDQDAAMGGYLGRYNKAMEMANVARDQRYRHENARMQSDLVARGMRSSTLSGKANFDAFERSSQIPLQAHLAASDDNLAFMERKNESGPSMDQMIGLARDAGQYQNSLQQMPQMMQMINQMQAQGQMNNPLLQQIMQMNQQLQANNVANSTNQRRQPAQMFGAVINGGRGYPSFQMPNLFGGGGGRRLPQKSRLSQARDARRAYDLKTKYFGDHEYRKAHQKLMRAVTRHNRAR